MQKLLNCFFSETFDELENNSKSNRIKVYNPKFIHSTSPGVSLPENESSDSEDDSCNPKNNSIREKFEQQILQKHTQPSSVDESLQQNDQLETEPTSSRPLGSGSPPNVEVIQSEAVVEAPLIPGKTIALKK